MSNGAREVGWRFRDEHEHIERYRSAAPRKIPTLLRPPRIYDLNRILKRVEIAPLPVRDYDRVRKPYSPDEVKELFTAISETEPEVYPDHHSATSSGSMMSLRYRLRDWPPAI